MASQPLKVLLVDDNPQDVARILEALSNPPYGAFEVERTDRLGKAIARVTTGPPVEVILLDLLLPDSAGLETLVRLQSRARGVPIVVMTASGDPEGALAALHRGAQDYLIKGLADAESIPRALLYAIERRRAQERLSLSQSQLEDAQALAHVGNWEMTIGSPEVCLSSELYRIFGMEPKGAGVPLDELVERVHPDDRALVRETLSATGPTGPSFTHEYRVVRPTGELRRVLCLGRVVPSNGGPARLMGTVQDVTDRKKLEEELMFAGRLAAVGALASGVAHEINNPLTYVMTNLEFVDRAARGATDRLDRIQAEAAQRPDAPARNVWAEAGGVELAPHLHQLQDALSEARQGAERIRNIVRDLRVFSQTESGRRGPIDLPTVLESSINLAWNEIRHRARLVKDYAPLPLVLGDASRLGQVFLNLLLNAAQAIQEGHAESNQIRISTRSDFQGRAVVEVRDTGSGMTDEVRARIFDPFFTTKPEGAGIGLGLSTCRRIAGELGGEIEVETEVGKGSLFRVILPAAPPAPVEPAGPAPGPPARRARLLVVDDEALVASSLRRVLSDDHDVEVSTDARDALLHIREGARYDAILCDLVMPEMTGMDLHAALLQEAPDQADRMIFTTGEAFTPGARAFLDRIANPRLEKPFDLKVLRSLLESVLR